MNEPALIAIDWGTTCLRAGLAGRDGRVLDRRSEPSGILNVPNADFDGVFERVVGPWLRQHPGIPVFASGMIGSRQGWHEAPYVECPAGAADLARALLDATTRDGTTIRFVPGLSLVDEAGIPDVMRGEETQIIGSLQPGDDAPQLFVLPGTHSKWALVDRGRILRFATFMTGEVFAVLRGHSILGRHMQGDADHDAAFRRGIDAAGETGAELLHRLFSVRTLGLFERLPATSLSSYLSGLIVGTEIGGAMNWLGRAPGNDLTVTVVGEARLTALYRQALGKRGINVREGIPDAAVAGIRRISEAAGLAGARHGG